jgi:hypothetical protein
MVSRKYPKVVFRVKTNPENLQQLLHNKEMNIFV